MNKIFAFSQGTHAWGHTDPGSTTDAGDESRILTEALRDDVRSNPHRRFAHVEAGIKLSALLEALDHPQPRGAYQGRDVAPAGQPARGRWTLPTMGGATGQSLAGVISTGTHGGDFNLSPIADMVRAIHIVAADGTLHWLERSGSASITSREKMMSLSRFEAVLLGLLPENIHYDDELFNAALVSLGRMGIVYAYVIEVRPQGGLSERVRPEMTWRGIREQLRGGAIFTGRSGSDWLREHPDNITSGSRRITREPRGVGVFINPYRLSDNYFTDPAPDRRVLLATYAEPSGELFDDVAHARPGGGLDDIGKAHLIGRFEHASDLGNLRRVVDDVLNLLRSPAGTTGYPIAHSVLTSTGEQQPILGMEIAVSTVGGQHVDLIDRLLAIFDAIIQKHWSPHSSGQRPKFAGGINLRYTRPTSALIGMQARTPNAIDERFCHIEIIVMKEVAIKLGDPVHAGHHNMESLSEEWVKAFEEAATAFGARLHWGQLQQLTRRQVERTYPDTLHRWRRAATRFLTGGDPAIFGNWFTQRSGLEPNTEILTATSWGPNRYDIFGFSERGEVLQLFFERGWRFANLGNRFPNGERFVGPLTSTSWGRNRIDIFGVGVRGTILQLWFDNGWAWTDLSRVFPAEFRADIPLLGPLAAASPAAALIELFGLAEGGDVWRFWYDGRRWNSQNLGNGFRPGERFFGSITAVSWGADRIDVFGVGSRGQVLQLWRQGGEASRWNWSDLSSFFPPSQFRIAGPLAGVATGGQRIDLFCKSENGDLLRLCWAPGWSSETIPQQFEGTVDRGGWAREFGARLDIHETYQFHRARCSRTQFVGPITAASWGERRLDVYGFGENGNVLQLWRDHDEAPWTWADLNNGWTRWRNRRVEALSVDLLIGGDGLDRSGTFHRPPSTAVGFVTLADGREIALDISRGQEWHPNTMHGGTISLPAGTSLGSLRQFGIRSLTTGNRSGADNWNLDEVSVTFVGPDGSGPLLRACGAPLARFTLDYREWTTSVALP